MAHQYIEAPNREKIVNAKSVFLAGGISNCSDWQAIASKNLSKHKDLTVINPRRAKWKMDKNEVEESVKQIMWEFDYIRKAKTVLFWFTNETLQPITLYELGAALQRNVDGKQRIIIGCDSDYERELDVRIQAKLIGYKESIHDNLDSLLQAVTKETKISEGTVRVRFGGASGS